jgi:hypothetical protein
MSVHKEHAGNFQEKITYSWGVIVEILVVFTQCESNSLIEKMEQATNHAEAGKCETF